MRLYYYHGYPNFGDRLNEHLWEPYFGPWLTRPDADDITLLGVGTLLGERDYGSRRLLVCGAGFGYQADTAALRQSGAHICFVRGKLSARVLGVDDSYAITDPGMLVAKHFPKASCGSRALWVPHWETAKNPLWRAAAELAGVDYVDPAAEVPLVMSKISGARLVLAESMHAAICADAFRVPWIPVVTSPRINLFKWYDWLSTLDVHPRFEVLPRLGWSDIARSLDAKRPNAALDFVLAELSVAQLQLEQPAAAKVFEWLMRTTRASDVQRSRVLQTLLWRIGPRLDALSLRLHFSRTKQALETAATALQRLAAQPSYLSKAARSLQLQAAMTGRIEAARMLLSKLTTR